MGREEEPAAEGERKWKRKIEEEEEGEPRGRRRWRGRGLHSDMPPIQESLIQSQSKRNTSL